jgi:hypothetical protein
MTENLHNSFDDLFRDSIEPLSEAPEKHVWENIEHQLDRDYTEGYKRKYIFYRRIAGILLLLLLCFGTFDLFNSKKSAKINPTDISIPNKNNGNNNSSALNGKPHIKDVKVFEDNIYKTSSVNKEKQNSISLHNLRGSIGHTQSPILESDIGDKNFQSQVDMDYDKLSPEEKLLLAHDDHLTDLNGRPLTQSKPGNPIVANLTTKEINRTKTNHHLFISVFAAPEYANYRLEDADINLYENKEVIQKRETNLLSFSSGILISYECTKKIIVQSGIIYTSSNINIDPGKTYAQKDNSGNIKYRYSTSSGYGYILPLFNSSPSVGDSLFTRTSVHNLQFISIPLIAHYKFINKKLSFNPGVGILVNFLTAASLTTEVKDFTNVENEVITNLHGLKKINLSFLLTSDLQYHLSEKWFLIGTPYLKYALSSINKQNVVKTYPYNIGFGMGVRYRLK